MNGETADCQLQNLSVQLVNDYTLEELERQRVSGLKSRLEEEVHRKTEKWQKETEKIKEEFFNLYPILSDKEDELDNGDYITSTTTTTTTTTTSVDDSDSLILKRRGSIDVLNVKKMKTLYLEYPNGRRFFKLRFKVDQFDKETIDVRLLDSNKIIVSAIKTCNNNKKIGYQRRIEKPPDVDGSKLTTYLTTDGILIVESEMPPKQSSKMRRSRTNLDRHVSPSPPSTISSPIINISPQTTPTTFNTNTTYNNNQQQQQQQNAPQTEVKNLKLNVPTFNGQTGQRKFSLMVDLGDKFKPKDVTVHILKNDHLLIRAKHLEKTKELNSKAKFRKEYDLSEPIERYTLRAGLMEDGRLLVGALGKNHDEITRLQAVEFMSKEIAARSTSCNVLDLVNFPPLHVLQTTTTTTIQQQQPSSTNCLSSTSHPSSSSLSANASSAT